MYVLKINYCACMVRLILPELEVKSFVQRQQILTDLVEKFSLLLIRFDATNVTNEMKWPEFCRW